jgi:hypothetical protein
MYPGYISIQCSGSHEFKVLFKRKKIVFDHLSPPKATLKGAEETYGPDFTYDAFIWKKGKWARQKVILI